MRRGEEVRRGELLRRGEDLRRVSLESQEAMKRQTSLQDFSSRAWVLGHLTLVREVRRVSLESQEAMKRKTSLQENGFWKRKSFANMSVFVKWDVSMNEESPRTLNVDISKMYICIRGEPLRI